MSSLTQQKQSPEVQQPAEQQGAQQQGAATDMAAFSVDTASEYQGSLGNQGVADQAFGEEGGFEAAGASEVDYEAWDALIAAVQIARGQAADPSGPWSDTLFRMMCTMHAASVARELHLSGEEAVKAAVEARDSLASAAEKVAEAEPDWVTETYQPAIDSYVVNVKADKIVTELKESGVEGGGSLLAQLDAVASKASDLSDMMALATGKTGETFVTTVVLPMVGEFAGETVRVNGEPERPFIWAVSTPGATAWRCRGASSGCRTRAGRSWTAGSGAT